jgi:hypothetical protein
MRVHASNLRTRQLWQDSDWVALPKVQLIPWNCTIRFLFAQVLMLVLMNACYGNYYG